jgi:nucleotide-binding universal stress UspA family protein
MYKNLLVPLDGSELSSRAATASLELAAQLGAGVTAFVAEPTAPLPALGQRPSDYTRSVDAHEARTEAHARDVLQRFAEFAAKAGVPCTVHFERCTNVDEAIVEAANRLGCDMIVMVTHGRGALGELLFGSHTKNVLSRSRTPLLVLH